MEAEDLTKKLIVRGQLRQPDGSPLSGISVRAYNKGLRSEQLLGEAVTDDKGSYEIKHDVASAALIVRAGPEGEELAASDIKFHAGPEETMDLRVPRQLHRSPSEFERLSKDLEPHLKEIKVGGVARPTLVHKLSDLKKDEIEILAGKMGGERQKVEQMAAAARMQMKGKEVGTDLPVEVFYALSKQGISLDLGAFYHRKSEDLRESLEKAVKENVLPSIPAENLDKAVKDLKRLSVKHVLNTSPKEGYATLSELFSLSLPDSAKQVALLSLFSEQERPNEDFWAKLKDHPDFHEPGLIDGIKLTSQLAVLTQNHLPLMQELQEKMQIKSLRDLADLDTADWKTLLRKEPDGKLIGIPAGITGDDKEQRIDNYANSIFENLRAAFPTTFVGKALGRQPKIHSGSLKDVLDSHPNLDLAKPLPDDFDWDSLSPAVRTSLRALQQEIRMFPEFDYKSALEKSAISPEAFENPIRALASRFFNNVPEFDLSRTQIDSYLAEHGEEAFKDIEEKDRPLVTNHLKALQRVFNITPKFEQIEALMGSGIDSAYAVSSTPKPMFFSYFAPLLGGEDQAKKIMAYSQQLTAKNALVYTTIYQETYDYTPAVIGDVSGEIKKIPNLENLFGRIDLCDCEHCRSFYSPAAYFVDLLHFLDSGISHIGWLKKPVPIDSLLKRRPDLAHIKLSCENTNTLIPYVDLVNEILEFYVAYGMLSPGAARDSEEFTSEELLADPQYIQSEAYEKLMEPVYPLSLPFNQPLEQSRLYLEHLGTNLWQLKENFAKNEEGSTLRAIDAEILGISPQEYEILTGEMFDGAASEKTLQEYYGFDAGNFDCIEMGSLQKKIEMDPQPDVIALQRMLNLAGTHPALDVDGKFGPLTEKAVIDFLHNDGKVGPETWKALLQAHPDCWKVLLAQVPVFLRHTGLSYTELVEIVKTCFINPNREILNLWDKTYVGYRYVKSYQKSYFKKLDKKVSDKLGEEGLSIEDYRKFAEESFIDTSSSPDISSVTVVLTSPDLDCDLSFTRVQNLNDSELTDLTLNKMHRFIRLWRKLGWSIHELDAALISLNNCNYGVIKPQILQDLAHIKQMVSELGLSPLVLLSFWGNIDANGKESLYQKLFLSKPDYIDEAFQPGSDGKVLTDEGKTIIEHESTILAALQVSSADLIKLLSELSLEHNDLVVNGIYGFETRAAVVAFQKKCGLEIDGIMGTNTWKALANYNLIELSKNMPVLKLGSKGKAVRALQGMLPHVGRATTLLPTGYFSQDTFYDVMAFQNNNDIADEHGIVGPETWTALISKNLDVFAGSMPALDIGANDQIAEILQRMLVSLGIKPAPYLTIGNVSMLYRHAVLAKALHLRIAEFLVVKKLCGIDPFKSTEDARRFIEIVSRIKESNFPTEQLNYIYSHISNPPSSFAPQRTNLLLLAKNLKDNLKKILEDNSATDDPTGEITRSKLGMVFDSQTVDETIKMLNNSMVYSCKLAKEPKLSLDTTGSSIISYNTVSENLRFKGKMTQSERKLLLSLSRDTYYQNAIDLIFQEARTQTGSGISKAPLEKMPVLALESSEDGKILFNKKIDPSESSIRFEGAMTTRERDILISLSDDQDYQNAIAALYQRPRDFISNALDKRHSGFLDIEDAKSKLFNDIPPRSSVIDPSRLFPPLQDEEPLETAGKFRYILENLQPYLQDKLSRSIVKQIVSDTLDVDASIAELLLEDLNSNGKAMKNCLGLITSGLSADYFVDPDFKNFAKSRIDGTLAFNGKGKTPESTIPMNSSSARWSALLFAPNNGNYSFFVTTNCDVKLWLDDKLIYDSADSTKTEKVGEYSFRAGQLYELRVEVVRKGSIDVAELSWSGPGTPLEIIPSSNLYPLKVFEDFAESFIWLHKVSLLSNGFGLSSKEITLVSDNPSDFEDFKFENLPAKSSSGEESNISKLFKSWIKLFDFVKLRDNLPRGEIALADIASCNSLKEMKEKLVLATGWDEKALDYILENTGFKFTGFRAGTPDWIPTIIRLQACMQKIKLLGISFENLFRWANEPIDSVQARMTKDAVKAKYDKETWLSVAKPINDILREKQRDALVAYVLTMPGIRQANVSGTNQLFEYFLIDPEMSACMKTSRIKQAISSVQLFVQRCLMNLEQNVSPEMIDSEQWDNWMKHYRMWEANRKVFLYPENWIEPELRDDKTPLFKEFESELLQNDVNMETTELALRHYLEKLDDIKKLEICAMCYDKELHAFHIFSRTYNSHKYYYIKLQINDLNENDPSSWICTPWQKVNLDIKGPGKGIHLLPILFNKRLYIFWPEFKDKSSSGKFSMDINLNYSEYNNGIWLPKQISEADSLKPEDIWWRRDTSETLEYFLNYLSCSQLIDESGKLFINFYEYITTYYNCPQGELEYLEEISKFSMRYCGAKIKAEKATRLSLNPNEATPNDYKALLPHHAIGYIYNKMVFSKDYPLNISLLTSTNIALNFEIFTTADEDENYSLIYADDFKTRLHLADSVQEFFYDDGRRSYFMIPFEGTVMAPDKAIYTLWLKLIPFFHPHVDGFMQALGQNGIKGLVTLENQKLGENDQGENSNFNRKYNPNPKCISSTDYPSENVEFNSGVYAQYNRELFFHAPLLIADRLSKNQRFEEAQKWFHYIFNPLDDSEVNPDSPMQRYWKYLPFYRNTDPEDQSILKILLALNDQDPELEKQVFEWKDKPFSPHLIARSRITAYQKNIVMKYIENLISWGDQLFRQDTIESINEATQLYILAANILGARPENIPPISKLEPKTYHDLRPMLNSLSNPMVNTETIFPVIKPISNLNYYDPMSSLASIIDSCSIGSIVESKLRETNEECHEYVDLKVPNVGYTFYFCIPYNYKLIECWDKVADRLLKIRNCMNIEGLARELPLFEPPIDPALLVQAAARGLDLSSLLSDSSSPMPYYRFPLMVQKALELCSEVRSYGAGLLSALEKKDAEELANMRAKHETFILEEIKSLKEKEINESQESYDALLRSRDIYVSKYLHYQQLLGVQSPSAPPLDSILSDYPASKKGITVESEGLKLILEESFEIDNIQDAIKYERSAGFWEFLANIAHYIPKYIQDIPPTTKLEFGGDHIGHGLAAQAKMDRNEAEILLQKANLCKITAGYIRREQEWILQSNLAAKEIMQIDKQIMVAEIKKEIAELNLSNHENQIENAKKIEDFLINKYTNEELYGWMIGQISGIYFQCYQMAFDMAKRAEKAYRFELGITSSNFIQFGYWDNLRKGLLAGEQLHLALKKMEKSYFEENRRGYEITKNISLVLHDPMSLIRLKETGECQFTLPEAFFDADYPGHYMRRIKSVSLTIPCVTGPYTSINCKLTLLSNKTRINSNAQRPYPEEEEDNRFVTNFAAMQSIATSHAQNDSGMFELNFRDERYLPFEGAGAISRWRIEMDKNCNAFDFNTISDIIIKLNYTSREGGELLRQKAKDAPKQIQSEPSPRLFSMKHEFPNEWYAFLTTQTLEFKLAQERFPFQLRGKEITVNKMELFLLIKDDANQKELEGKIVINLNPAPIDSVDLLPDRNLGGVFSAQVSEIDKDISNTWKLAITDNAGLDKKVIEDLIILCHYSAQERR